MRLNRVESFDVFLLRFRSEGSEEEGQPATASPHVGPAAHGQAAAQAPYKGGRPATARASPQGRPVAPARGDSRPQGQCLWAEASSAGTTACRTMPARGAGYRTPARGYCTRPALLAIGAGGTDRRGGRPLAERLPMG
ncbi:hypothetical protein BHE74_00021309 [Ensete ventricosum]|nr:hypothetical protein BHE74_00021309 [Ensete ventricosum]